MYNCTVGWWISSSDINSDNKMASPALQQEVVLNLELKKGTNSRGFLPVQNSPLQRGAYGWQGIAMQNFL